MRNVVFVMLFMSFSMSARRMELSQANFSPLGIRLPWLRAPTVPKQRMRNMFFAVCVCVSVNVQLCLFISLFSKWFMKHLAYLRPLCLCREVSIWHGEEKKFAEKTEKHFMPGNVKFWHCCRCLNFYSVSNVFTWDLLTHCPPGGGCKPHKRPHGRNW